MFITIKASNGRAISGKLENFVLINDSGLTMGGATAGGTGFRVLITNTTESFGVPKNEYDRIHELMDSSNSLEASYLTNPDSKLGDKDGTNENSRSKR